MTLAEFKNAIKGIHERVYRYRAVANAPLPYIVWSEDSANDLVSNNKHIEFRFEGTVDLFTRTEDDPLIMTITEFLNSQPIAWRLDTVIFEEDTNVIHYVWIFDI